MLLCKELQEKDKPEGLLSLHICTVVSFHVNLCLEHPCLLGPWPFSSFPLLPPQNGP